MMSIILQLKNAPSNQFLQYKKINFIHSICITLFSELKATNHSLIKYLKSGSHSINLNIVDPHQTISLLKSMHHFLMD